MSLSESGFDRLTLVSSLYGPGAVASWLCIVMSVLVTWTLNLRSRHRDSITNDFIAALSMPIFAAAHVFYLLSPSAKPSQLELPIQYGRTLLLTTSTPSVAQYAAAVAAPLIICDTFSVLALILFAIAALHGCPRRAFAVLIVGLLAFSTETMILAHTSGIDAVESNLARPLSFNFVDLMLTVLISLSLPLLGLVFLAANSAYKMLARRRAQGGTPEENPGHELQDLGDEEILQMQPENEAMVVLLQGSNRISSPMWPVLMIITPLPVLVSISTGGAILGMKKSMEAFNLGELLLFFIPETSNSLVEIDQLATLCGGLCTLAFSFWDAFKSRRGEILGQTSPDDNMNRRIRREEEMSTRSQRILLQRRLNEVQRIQCRLDEGVPNPKERRDLITRQQRLRQEIGPLVDILLNTPPEAARGRAVN